LFAEFWIQIDVVFKNALRNWLEGLFMRLKHSSSEFWIQIDVVFKNTLRNVSKMSSEMVYNASMLSLYFQYVSKFSCCFNWTATTRKKSLKVIFDVLWLYILTDSTIESNILYIFEISIMCLVFVINFIKVCFYI
jgi:hypothetical protein